jgi:hypothetical protein
MSPCILARLYENCISIYRLFRNPEDGNRFLLNFCRLLREYTHHTTEHSLILYTSLQAFMYITQFLRRLYTWHLVTQTNASKL